MTLLLVLGSDDNSDIISKSIRPLGFELIRYRHVLKAMDNIDEISPSAIVVSARDFPRHWKILVQFVRSALPNEMCPIIVLKGSSFCTEETSKAFFLGVSGVVDDALNKPEEINRLQNILSRYVPVHEKRKHYRFFVEPWNRIGFLMTNEKVIITGDVKTISSGGISFLPDESMPPQGIALNTMMQKCSLRIGSAILSPDCRVVRTGIILSLEFVAFTSNEQSILEKYLDEFPLMESGSQKEI